MNKITAFVLGLLALVIVGIAVYTPEAKAAGCAPFLVASGGTGVCAIVTGAIPFGNGTSKVATSSGLTWNTTNNNLAFTYGSTTALTVTGIMYAALASTSNLTISNLGNTSTNCLQISTAGVVSATGSACAGGGFQWPFTPSTYNSIVVSATSTPLWDTYTGPGPGLIASSTFFTQASTTQFTNSGNTWLTALTSGRVPFASTAGLLQDSASFLWSSTESRLTATNASTTVLTAAAAGALYIPNAANPVVGTTAGRLAIDTTDASSSLHWVAGGNEYAVFASTSVSFNYATSSPAGTTTIVIAGPTRKVVYDQIGCTSVGGTATVQMGTGTASTTMVTSGTSLTATFTKIPTNSTFGQGVSRLFALGNWSGTGVTQVSCTLSQGYDPN